MPLTILIVFIGLDSESREVKWLSELAEKFFNNEVELHKKMGKESSGNKMWMQNVITSGYLKFYSLFYLK